jgi:hypothetical protein
MNPLQTIVSDGEPLHGGWCTYMNEDFCSGGAVTTTNEEATFDLIGTSGGFTYSDADLNGVGLLTATTNTTTLIQAGEPVQLAANRKIIFDTRINVGTAAGMDMFVGLAINSVDFMSAITDSIGFYLLDGAADLFCQTGINNAAALGAGGTAETRTNSNKDLVDATFVNLKFIVDGITQVRYFVDGALVATINTTLPTDEAMGVHMGIQGSTETMDIDYIFGVVQR